MKKFLLILAFSCSQILAQVPDKEGSLVKWMSLEEAMAKTETLHKPLLIDFYTDWCGWCKTMMKTTYGNPGLAQYINTYFYPVKFDAEGKDTIDYQGVKYVPTSNLPRSTHPLAAKLLNNKLVYPTTLFLNNYDKEKKEFKMSMIASGYLEMQNLEPILIFILENAGRNSSYDDFKVQFFQAFYDSTTAGKQKFNTWLSPHEAFEKQLPSKKMLVLINTTWCSTCQVMKSTSFIDTIFHKYLNEKFYLVDFDPEMTDTVSFKGQQYYNPKEPQAPFHQLAYSLGKNSITFPSMIILDENMEVVDVIPSFIPARFLNDIIHYYGDNVNKEKSWEEYIKVRKVN